MKDKPDWFYFVMFCCYSFCLLLVCGASASKNADIFFGYAVFAYGFLECLFLAIAHKIQLTEI